VGDFKNFITGAAIATGVHWLPAGLNFSKWCCLASCYAARVVVKVMADAVPSEDACEHAPNTPYTILGFHIQQCKLSLWKAYITFTRTTPQCNSQEQVTVRTKFEQCLISSYKLLLVHEGLGLRCWYLLFVKTSFFTCSRGYCSQSVHTSTSPSKMWMKTWYRWSTEWQSVWVTTLGGYMNFIHTPYNCINL